MVLLNNSLKKTTKMKKKIRKMSDAQKMRIIDKNRKVFWRLNRALVARIGSSRAVEGVDKLPLFNFMPQPMSFANFGAMMANTRTHKRNNR